MTIGTKKKISARVMDRLAQSEGFKIKGKYEKALEIAEKILIDDPACVEAAEEVADNLLSLARYDAAKKASEYVLQYDKTSYIAHFVIGFIASHQEKWAEAVEHLSVSNAEQGNNPEILRCLGWALFRQGNRAEGVAILNRALALRQDDPVILCDIADCMIDLGRFPDAITYLKKAKELSPRDSRVSELLLLAEESGLSS